MKKTIIICLLVALLIMMVLGCGQKESLPGVIERENGNWYIVKLPAGKTVTDYFALTGQNGTIHVTNMGHMDINESMGNVNYSQVNEGGWIFYCGDVFMYVPTQISEFALAASGATLIRNSDNYLLIEDAKQYIPFLK